MAKHSENGLDLRWDAPDLPVAAVNDTTVRALVAIRPAHPANGIQATYALNGGAQRLAYGQRLNTAMGPMGEEVFAVDFPNPPPGSTLHFLPRGACAGRSADPRRAGMAATVIAPVPPKPKAKVEMPAPPPTFPFDMDLLARVTVKLERRPVVIGEVPDGLRIDFPLGDGGFLSGPRLNGTILHSGEDWMLVRRDGIGLSEVRVLIRTDGGDLVMGDYGGVVDFGPDGYDALVNKTGPDEATVQLTPRYVTAAGSLQWLNRLQCIGMGRVIMKTLTVEYDLYALRSRAVENI